MHARYRASLPAVLLLMLFMLPAAAQDWPFAYRQLPNSLDLMEAGLYWMQDLTRPAQTEDPASLLVTAQELAARQFDFAELSWAIGGFDYLRRDILARSHYQNRIRDRLFAELARVMGLYDPLPPTLRPLPPLRMGVDRAVIAVWVWPRQRIPQLLEFHLHADAQGWRIVDVADNGKLFSQFMRERMPPP